MNTTGVSVCVYYYHEAVCMLAYLLVSPTLCMYWSEKTRSVSPRAGTALVFNHDTLHEGLPVTRGVKYIVRTEIMYRRVDRDMIPDPLSYKQDGDYLTTLALYQKSWRLEQGLCPMSLLVEFKSYIYVYLYMYMYVCIYMYIHK